MPIDERMTVDERRKYLKVVALRYAKAGRAQSFPGRTQRSGLLTEMEAVTGLSYSQVRRDLDRLRVILLEVEGQRYLLRTELQGQAHAAFQAAGVRPPAHIQAMD